MSNEHMAHDLCHRFRTNRRGIDPDRLDWSGKYIRRYFLASGGQGSISTAYKPFESNRELVIKVINGEEDGWADAKWGGYVNRMRHLKKCVRQEIKHLRRLRHPNIIKLLDSWELPDDDANPNELYVVGDVYQVMEKYEGDLSNLLVRDFLVEIQQVDFIRSIAKQIVGALEHCHEQGIVHRDIKPGNILWKFDGPQSFHFVLADFGLANEPGKLNPDWEPPVYWWFPPEYYGLTCRQEPASDMWMFGLLLLWIVNDAGLRSGEAGRFSMKELWNRVDSALGDGQWGNWARIMQRDPDQRISAADFIALTNNFEIGPDLEGHLTLLDPSSKGAYPRRTESDSFPEVNSRQEPRCWHGEIRSVSPSALSPSQRCHCDERILKERDVQQNLLEWPDVDPPRPGDADNRKSTSHQDECQYEGDSSEGERRRTRADSDQLPPLDAQNYSSAYADESNLVHQTSLINITDSDGESESEPEHLLSEESLKDLEELVNEDDSTMA